MTGRILLISPNDPLIATLRHQLTGAGFSCEPTVLTHYPRPEAMKIILGTRQEQLTVAVIDLAKPTEALRIIRRLKASDLEVLVIAVDSYHRLSSIVAAKRAGVWAYLMPPYNLRQLVEQLQEGKIGGKKEAKSRLISFIPAQGGNGASTVSLHVADAIARKFHGQTLLTDFDFHCGTIAFQLRLEPKQTLADALRAFQRPSEDWRGSVCSWNHLDVLVAPPSNATVSSGELAAIPPFLATAREAYRHVVVDLPPSIFSSSRDIMKLSNVVCLVCTPEITSLHLARRKVAQMLKLGVSRERLRLLVNRVSSWGAVEIERVSALVGLNVEWVMDNDYPAVRKAAWEGGLISEHSALATQLRELGAQITISLPSEGLATRPVIDRTSDLATQLHQLATHVRNESKPVIVAPEVVK